MPSSALTTWPAILHMVWQAQPESVLDCGPGRGKGGLLLAEYVGRVDGPPPNGPLRTIDALEVEPSYVTPRLKALYDTVHLVDVRAWTFEDFYPFDLVLLVDVIEHLHKHEGLEVLRRIPGRVVISTPSEFFSNGPGLPDSEEHRSLWTREDFESVRTVEVDASMPGGVTLMLAPM